MRFKSSGLVLLSWCWLMAGTGLAAEFPAPAAAKPQTFHPAVVVEERSYAQPRPLRAWVVKVDLSCPELELIVTPKVKVEPPFEALGETTLEFARKQATLLAINSNAFGPSQFRAGHPVTINGLMLSKGQMLSPPEANYTAVVWDALNRPAVLSGQATAEEASGYFNGVAGFQLVLEAGRNRYAGQPPGELQPRTALGFTADRRTMIWLIVDGRQPQVSEGITEAELGELALQVGCHELLNLDGGGSTTLVALDTAKGQPRVVNTPVGMKMPGTLRPNGGHLGIRVWTRQSGVTLKQLQQIMPSCKPEQAQRYLVPLNNAMAEFGIDSTLRRAAFLAMVANETYELKHLADPAGGAGDELRLELGNAEPGDAVKYKGRGPLLIRGKTYYREAGRALNLDLELHPEWAASPEAGCRLAGWYWQHRKMNALADTKDLETLTKRLTSRFDGVGQRAKYYQRAVEVLGRE